MRRAGGRSITENAAGALGSERDLDRVTDPLRLRARGVRIDVAGQRDSHAAVSPDLRFAEEPHSGVGFGEGLVEAAEADRAGVAIDQQRVRRRRPELADVGDRQPQDRAGVQRELREILGDQCDHSGVVGARRHLREVHRVALDKQLDTEDPPPAERPGHRARDHL